ncbi:hypothetical protein GCM10009547_08930 [Sporichthya brevicatena]|uniref:Thioesterase domain-containing protein n=1 Tax=Sporichthya brevicatena TaxID=171442 RepID=A0ABN1GD84_9ACTN
MSNQTLEPLEPELEHLHNRPGPQAPSAEWAEWANGTPQLRGLGIECTAAADGTAEFTVSSVPYVPNPNGSVNGGMLSAIADQVMGVLTAMACPPGYLAATASLHIQFHRPAHAPLDVRGALLPGGSRVKFVEVVIRDRTGEHCATAQGTMIVGGAARPESGESR